MDLNSKDVVYKATKAYDGIEVVDVEGGQTLKVETSPDGEEVLSVVCPDGKAWKVQIQVQIYEE